MAITSLSQFRRAMIVIGKEIGHKKNKTRLILSFTENYINIRTPDNSCNIFDFVEISEAQSLIGRQISVTYGALSNTLIRLEKFGTDLVTINIGDRLNLETNNTRANMGCRLNYT